MSYFAISIYIERISFAEYMSNLTIKTIEEKLGKHKIESEINSDEENELIIKIPEERGTRTVFIDCEEVEEGKIDKEIQEALIDTDFEKFRYVKGYEGIWSKELDILEVEIGSNITSNRGFIRSIKRLYSDEIISRKTDVSIPSPNDVNIFFGESSTEFKVLSELKTGYFGEVNTTDIRSTIKFKGANLDSHAKAFKLIETLLNSILFQIDLVTNISIFPVFDRTVADETSWRRRNRKKVRIDVPKYSYENAAISLYWYANSAFGMPLLQYLAYYQVLEHYFPYYMHVESQQKIRNYIKDPRFNLKDDNDITRIISIARSSQVNGVHGDERSQLKATVRNCVELSELSDFVSSDKERKEFFLSKKKGLANKIVSITVGDKLIDDVAIRIYELRCKIVHTKNVSDSGSEKILPFSSDIKKLRYDLELLEFIARKIIIAQSSPL